jgi:hypothetical protein
MQSDTLDFLFLARTAVEASQLSDTPGFDRHNVNYAAYSRVRFYVHDGLGSRVCLGEASLENVNLGHTDDSGSIKVTEREFIAETKFFLVPKSPIAERPYFLVTKHALIHWQRQWRFSVDTPFAITSAYDNLAQAQFAKRSINTKGDLVLAAALPDND